MKKISAMVIVAIVLFCVASCSKKTSYTNFFTFQNATYPISVSGRDSTFTTRSITFSDPTTSETGTITCTFDSILPVTSGSYKIVNATSQTLAAGQMTLELTIGLNSYYATGNDNISASITRSSSGLYSVSIPSVWVASTPGDTLGPPAVDSAKLSATLTEIK